jgi:hypothetical protein
MTIGTIKTQGTELWVIDTISATDPAVLKFACPTGLTGLGGPSDQIETTCLESTTTRTYVRGMATPGAITVPFNFIPSNGSHQVLFDLQEDGSLFDWMVGLADGTAAPTLNSDDEFVPPVSPLRTTLQFSAYVADITIDIATNEIVRGTMLLQRSGDLIRNWNGPTPA